MKRQQPLVFVAIFLGGGVGASLRYSISVLVNDYFSRPWAGTLVVNFLGCSLFFIIFKALPQESKLLNSFLLTGLLGGLTTFSAFSFELYSLILKSRWVEAIAVVALNVVTGVIVGFAVFRKELF